MPYIHVPSPKKGYVPAVNPVVVGKDEADESPLISGMYLRDEEIVSDYGYTAYPTPGLLKTNLLNGVPLKFDSFTFKSGTNFLIGLTTTNAYQYNTSTTTWDCITKGQTIDSGEAAWTASANVTCSADTTTKLRGSKSAKQVIATAFTTGLAAYNNFAALDLHLETGVHFWIYSSVATLSGDMQLLLDDTNNCVSPLELLNIPALAANTWTPVYLPYASAAGDTAIVSVGLKIIVDNGAQNVWIDDVRSVDAFTGAATNMFSTTVYNDTYLVTNGVNQPKKYLGVAATGMVNMTTTLNVGSLTTAEIVLAFKDHILFFNTTENGAACPQRCTWGNIGQIEDLINGTAGYQDLIDSEDWVVSVITRAAGELAVFKEHSILVCTWVGGQTPFRFDTMILNKTIAGKNCALSLNGILHVLGTRDMYTYGGGRNVEILGPKGVNIEDQPLKRAMFNSIDYSNITKSFLNWVETDDELQVFVPTVATSPDQAYCYDYEKKVWYIKVRNITAIGPYTSQSGVQVMDLVGTIGSQNYRIGDSITKSKVQIFIVGDPNGNVFKMDTGTFNNGSTAISKEFQTPDFILPTDYEAKFLRTTKLMFEAKGTAVTTEYSIDGGATWQATQGNSTNLTSLISTYAFYEQDFDVTSRIIRFRFRNSTLSSGFTLRYYGFYYHPRSSRR